VNPQTHPTPKPGEFVAHDLAIEAAGLVYQLVDKVSPTHRSLADQARRAAASVPLNLAEGAGRAGNDRLQHFRIAFGSAKETKSAIHLLTVISAVDSTRAARTLALLDRVNAMSYRLAHPRS
jgi:four helix bundle protein